MKWWHYLLLGLVLALAAMLRWTGLDWDGYNHYHPDERYVAWVATTIELPARWVEALDPHLSPLNPFYWSPDAASEGIEVPQDEPRSFAYGHVPLYLAVAATRIVEWVTPLVRPLSPEGWLFTRDVLNAKGAVEFRHLTAVARALAGLFDLGTVLFTFLLGRRLFGVAAGLLAAALLAVSVMHIQLAHFFAVDPFLTFFVVATVWALVAAGQSSGRRVAAYAAVAAISGGLAVGSKFSAVMLVLPVIVWLWFDEAFSNGRFILRLSAVVGLGALVFVLTNPFAFLDNSCEVITPAVDLGFWRLPALDWGSCYLENILRQGAMVSGELDAPFARQYTGTLPFLYQVEMQVRWGMGPLLGLLALLGLGWALWRGLRAVWRSWRERSGKGVLPALSTHLPVGEWIVLAWVLPYLLVTGNFFVKFMRYMAPVTPFLIIYAAAFLLTVRPVWLRRVAAGATLLFTFLFALSFTNIYRQEHPWTAASQWLFKNAATGSLILSEQWDQALPTSMVVDGTFRRRFEYEYAELSWLTGADAEDDLDKLEGNLEVLAQGDYLVVASNRVYGVTPRLPERYPLSSQVYDLLFSGELGYELAYVAARTPELGGVYLKPDTFAWPNLEPPAPVSQLVQELGGVDWGRADESFLVYDQPLTMVFVNEARLSAAEMLTRFE